MSADRSRDTQEREFSFSASAVAVRRSTNSRNLLGGPALEDIYWILLMLAIASIGLLFAIRRPTYERVIDGLALVPEGRLIFGDFSVEENLRLGAFVPRARKGPGAEIAADPAIKSAYLGL